MNLKKSLIILLIFNISVALFARQSNIEEIDVFCSEIFEIIGTDALENTGYIRYFDTDTGDQSGWIPESEEDYDLYTTTRLNIYSRDNTIVFISLLETTPSGDWSRESGFYFREDGSTSYISTKFLTFLPPVIIEEEYYFSAQGKEMKKTTVYKDFDTEEVLEEEIELFFDPPTSIYKSAKEIIGLLEE